MSKFYGYDEAMENDIAKITTPKLALMSDVVASDKKFIRMENGALTVIAGVLIAVGNSVFKTEKTTLTASNLDGTASKFEVGKRLLHLYLRSYWRRCHELCRRTVSYFP